MAHEVENMMYVGETPWHGLGVKLDAPPSTREAIIAAKLDWNVEMRPVHVEGAGRSEEHSAAVRVSDNSVLGIMGSNYQPLQNDKAFAFFDPFLESGTATIETAGSLRQGRRVFILARVKGDPIEIVANDPIERFILLSNSHDGTLAIRAGFTPIRVVCQNTLTAAHNSVGSKLLRVRHSRKAEQTLDIIRDTMNILNGEFEASAEQFKILAATDINGDDFKKYVRAVFPEGKKAKPGDLRADRIINELVPLFEAGRGSDLPGVRGTLWGAYNAITEYTSWMRGRSQDNRLNSLWFGASANTNAKALEEALKFAA